MGTTDTPTPKAATFASAVVQQIKAERAARDLSMEQLSERSGISLAALSRYLNERRELTIANVERIAEALGLGTDTLLRRAAERSD